MKVRNAASRDLPAEAFYVAHEFARCTGPWLYRIPAPLADPS